MSHGKKDLLSLTIFLWCVICLVFAQDHSDSKAKAPRTSGQTISARTDKTGQHPGTAAIKGPATIKCTSATSNIPRPQPPPSCYVTAPGYSGQLNKGQSAGASGAGTVTLICNGQGDILTCSASVQ